MVDHVLHPALAQRQHLRDHPQEVLGHVDRQPLDRLVELAVDLARDHLRLAHRELEALAPSSPPAGELRRRGPGLPRFAPLGLEHPDGHVAHQLLGEPLLDLPRGEPRARLAGQRGRVDSDRHPEAGSSTAITGSGCGSSGSAIVSPMVISGMPATAMISPGPASSATRSLQPLVHVELAQAHVLHRAVVAAPGHGLPAADRAVVNPAQRQPAHVGVGIEVGHACLQACSGSNTGAGMRSTRRSNSGLRSLPSTPLLQSRPARLGVRVDDRELDLILAGVEIDERCVDLVHHLGDAGVGAVDLVHHEHHRQPPSSALRSTKRVWGSGPSEASTSSITPSTIVRPRSTSPPKSAWPGVSTRLSFTSP